MALLGKAYLPTFWLFAAVLSDALLGLFIAHYSTWFNGLSAFVLLGLIGFIVFVSIMQPTSEG
jgi:hypothetical protein